METQRQLEERRHFFARHARALRADMGSWPSAKRRLDLEAALDDVAQLDDEFEIRAAAGRDDLERLVAREAVEMARVRQRFDFENLLRTGLRNSMSATTGSQGGYTVAPLVVGEIIDALKGYGFVRQLATSYTTSTGAQGNIPTTDGTNEMGERLPESGSAASSDPSFGVAPINAVKYGSKVVTVPFELLQDSAFDIVGWLTQRCVDRIGRIQNQDFTFGTGVNQPTGLLTAANVGKLGTTGQTTTILYDDLVDLADSVDAANLGQPRKQEGVLTPSSAGWMMSQTTRRLVRKIKDTNGMPVWQPALGAEPAQLLDFPVFINNDMPTPAASAKSLAFGNFGRYAIRDVRQFVMYRFADGYYATKGQCGFVMFGRAGGNLTDPNAVKTFQHPAS